MIESLAPVCLYCHAVIVIDPRPRNGGARRKGVAGDEQQYCNTQCRYAFHHLSENAQMAAKIAADPFCRQGRLDQGLPEFGPSPKSRVELMRLIRTLVNRQRRKVKEAMNNGK